MSTTDAPTKRVMQMALATGLGPWPAAPVGVFPEAAGDGLLSWTVNLHEHDFSSLKTIAWSIQPGFRNHVIIPVASPCSPAGRGRTTVTSTYRSNVFKHDVARFSSWQTVANRMVQVTEYTECRLVRFLRTNLAVLRFGVSTSLDSLMLWSHFRNVV
ncbi:uncharacterized protein BO97DRAFT_223963 [Aspergillus homomorphus CBS 101889]|uniref:Uncharacterized protein n=1 Tax=Aspergillus homomorphus (strain CBS 101889) TaxID=1450537 RepID=A0A395HLC4_ASPHC|nr:hypothetical protein BO97DRAFT_223963 [Aspergillus homomorphus CBS 101889]RAL08279.1 hypothetical protein BO97DRAFT_223963 [Aspergillus homomorphus CBS 101889]